MKPLFKSSLMALACASSVLLTACNDDNDDDYVIQPPTGNYVSESAYQKDSIANAASVNVMTYNMPNVLGESKKATAMVFTPKTEKPANGWRVVVWEHGTV